MSVRDELLAAAERTVERARSRPGVQGAEAYVALEEDTAAHIEKNSASTVAARESYGIGIRILSAGRLGFAFVTDTDDVAGGIAEAMAACRMSKKTPFSFQPARKAPRIAGLWDAKVADLQPEAVVEHAAATIAAVLDVDAALNAAGGGVSRGVSHWAVANSEGLGVAHRESGFSASCYVVQEARGVSTGSADRSSTRLDFRPSTIGKEAAELAIASARPTALEGAKVRDVVVLPDAAADLLATITVSSLSGRTAHRQESYYSGKIGRDVASKGFGLTEDPLIPGGLGSSPVDDEGAPSKSVRLISRGVLRSFVFDRATAAEFDGTPTASAVRVGGLDGRSFKGPPTASSRQVRVVSPRTTTDKLISSVDDGVLVHDMMGVHTANTVSGDFGVTASLLFRIEGGAVAGPLKPASVSGNLHESLKRGIRLGDDDKRVDSGVAFRLPSTLFRGFTVTP
jgi:PmbA protein